MTKLAFIGIDVGTSGIKALAVDLQGNILASHNEHLNIIIQKPGWTEQNPLEWWAATIKSLKAISLSLKSQKIDFLSIGLSGQMHSLVILDKNDNSLDNAILWNDGRTTEECNFIKERSGENLGKITGNPALEGFTAPKIIWLKNNKPKLFSKIKHMMMPKDYIRFKLTGEKFSEPTDASGTLLYDIHKNKWSSTMSSILDIDVSLFPKIITSNDISGYLKKDVAEQTGLKNTIPIVAGGADNACASLGAGVLNEGSLMLTVGTSGAVVAPSTKPEFDPLLRVHLMRHVSPKTWYKMGVILSAGGALDWWSKISDVKNIQDLINEIPDNPKKKEDILFLPYITGERTPYANPKARGVFFGLNAKTSRADLTYSVLQGIALALRDSLNLISTKNKINNAVLVGGGAKSKKWQKIIADTLQLNIMLIGQSEGASLGAAMLASCYSKEYFNSINEVASNWISVKDKIEPNHNESDYYSELHSRYSNLYNSIKLEYE